MVRIINIQTDEDIQRVEVFDASGRLMKTGCSKKNKCSGFTNRKLSDKNSYWSEKQPVIRPPVIRWFFFLVHASSQIIDQCTKIKNQSISDSICVIIKRRFEAQTGCNREINLEEVRNDFYLDTGIPDEF